MVRENNCYPFGQLSMITSLYYVWHSRED